VSATQSNLSDFTPTYPRLSPAETGVYHRVEVLGEEIDTAAFRTGRQPSTVRTLLHRARRKRGEAPEVSW